MTATVGLDFAMGMFRKSFARAALVIGLASMGQSAAAQTPVPNFTAEFSPGTIGPGASSTLIFTIETIDSTPISDLAFSNTLPASMLNAALTGGSTTCTDGIVTVSDPRTFNFSGGKLGAFSTCTVSINVSSSTVGPHTNTSDNLSSSAGNSGSATADLTVSATLPGFTKAFLPPSVSLGGTSTLTYTIDNIANGSRIGNLDFTETLPTGMEIASPANAATTCISAGFPDTTLTATPGGSVVTLDANGSTVFPGFEVLPAGATCTVTLDVKATGIGVLTATSGQLLADFSDAGSSSASLDVTAATLNLSKTFLTNPANAGGTTDLQFTIENFSRSDSATNIAFTDDLDAALSGLAATGTPISACGGTLSGTSPLTFSGGSLAAGADCTFSVTLDVPGGAATGSYTNTTSAITGDIGGAPVTGNAATATLQVLAATDTAPTLTMTVPDGDAGLPIDVEFTFTNNASVPLTNGVFQVLLTPPLSVPVTAVLPSTPCGAGSALSYAVAIDAQSLLFSGGNLDGNSSCTFTVTITLPSDLSGGTYTLTSNNPTATVNGTTRTGPPASDDFTVNGGLNLTFRKFFGDSVLPGGSTTLTFEIQHLEGPAATDINFIDDLDAMLSGTTATLPPLTNTCGGAMNGTSSLSYTGGSLASGSCEIVVTVNVPVAAASGPYTNSTEPLKATPTGGTERPFGVAEADLTVAEVRFEKEFLPASVIAGDTTTLRYTITNESTDPASNIFFTDSLNAALSGLVATGTPISACGGTLSGTSSLTFSGGSVNTSSSCTIEVEVLVPSGATANTYNSVSSALSVTVGVSAVSVDPASASLTVNNAVLNVTKSFAADSAFAGDDILVTIAIENTTASAVSDVQFSDNLTTFLAGTESTNTDASNSGCGTPTIGYGTTFSVSGASIAASSICTFTFTASLPGGASTATHKNTTSAVLAKIGPLDIEGAAAWADLQVLSSTTPTFTKSFDGPTTANGTAVLTFSLANPSGVDTMSELNFTDDLGAMLSGATATLPAISDTCGGALGGSSLLTYSGGTLPPLTNCAISVTVNVPGTATAGGTFTNTTSELTMSGLFLAVPATADIVVEPTPTPGVTLGFAPASIVQGATTTMTVAIDNTGALVDATALAVSFPAIANLNIASSANASTSCTGGTLVAPSGSGIDAITYTGGTLAAGASCTVQVDLTSDVFDSYAFSATAASSLGSDSGGSVLDVTEAPAPGFTKAFAPDSIPQGGTSTLTFTIDNTALVGVTDLSFADNLPASVTVASAPNVVGDCGGTVTATAGTGVISLTGGSRDAGASCTIAVDVTSTTIGPVTNTTGQLGYSFGALRDGLTATDDLTVTAAPAPIFTKVFNADLIRQGEETTLTFTIDNTAGLIAGGNLAFVDDFNTPSASGLRVAAAPDVSNTCGGTFNAATDDTSVSLSGGTVPIGGICEISVRLRAYEMGTIVNTTSDLTSDLSTAAGATGTLTVNPATAPVFTKLFVPDTIDQGQETVLTFTIDNSANLIEATDLTFLDDFNDPSVSGLVVADAPAISNTCNGTFSPVAGDTSVDLAAGTIAAGATCEISVTLRALLGGTIVNVTSDLTSSIATAAGATDTLTVTPATAPLFSKLFTPDAINQGETSVLSFTIDNSANSIEAADMAFVDAFPSGIIVAGTPAISNGCGGTFTAAALAEDLSLVGGQVDAGATCQIDVTVQALTADVHVNTTGDLTSTLGNSGTATATLTAAAVPLGLTMSFSPTTIEQFRTSTVIYGMRNTAVIEATGITLIDTLPANMIVASPANASTTCSGGTLTATAGSDTISYVDGSLAAGGGCTVTVDVTSSVPDTYNNTTESQTSSLGDSTPASASLTVEPATLGAVTFVQNSDTDGVYSFTSTQPLLTFLIEVSGGTGQHGPVELENGTYSVSIAAPTGVALTALSCDDTDSTGDAASGILTLNVAVQENITCTIEAEDSVQQTVDTINRFLTRRADLILSSEPTSNRRINRLIQGFGNSSPFTFSNGDLNSLLPFTADVNRSGGAYKFSTSLLQVRQAAASIALAHGSTKDAVYVDNYRFDAWFEAQYKEFDSGAQGEGHFAIAYMGADYLLTPDVLIGALLQVDNMKDVSSTSGSTANGTGWMVGPYITARLAPNLYFDARVARGASTNEVSPFNTYVDTFKTDRWLAVASLTGDFQKGPWSIRPNASLSYFEENQDSYVDSVGSTIPGQTVALGQLQVGPTFTGHFEGDNGTLYAPYLSLDAVYNIGDTTGVTVTNAANPATDGWRGRIKAGISMITEDGVQLGFGGTYDGLFRSDFDVWGLTFSLDIPLKKAKAR